MIGIDLLAAHQQVTGQQPACGEVTGQGEPAWRCYLSEHPIECLVSLTYDISG
jgi:hypothetical protein